MTHFTDRMTDKSVAVATVSAPPGTLRVTCSGPTIEFDTRVAFGKIGVSYRFDNGEVVPRFFDMLQDGRTLLFTNYLLTMTREISRAKRLRMTVFLPGQSAIFMDFDLTGAKDAIKALGCRG